MVTLHDAATLPGAIGREACQWLRVQELEGRPAPTLRAVSQIVGAADDETVVHRQIVNLRHSGHVLFTHLHTGRVIHVHLTDPGRAVGDRMIARSGQRLDPVRKRKCMMCPRHFVSDGNGHRICDDCKRTQSWRNADYEPLHV